MTKDRKDTAIYSAYEDYDARDPAAPEKNLLLAILMTAVRDLEKAGATAQQARDYFLEQDDTYVFSFVSVCTLLGVSAERVLNHLGLLEHEAAGALFQKSSENGHQRALPGMRKRSLSNGNGRRARATSHSGFHQVK